MGKKIPKKTSDNIPKEKRMIGSFEVKSGDEYILFSFAALERNEYFNLDGTCQNWAADLFATITKASRIKISDVYSGIYSGKNSPFRIHSHEDATPPCHMPQNVSLKDMWQIRISKSKGGIHGVFYENIFYVIWLDPQHNLYPDKNHGGLKQIKPPSTCCKERDTQIDDLETKLKSAEETIKLQAELLTGYDYI